MFFAPVKDLRAENTLYCSVRDKELAYVVIFSTHFDFPPMIFLLIISSVSQGIHDHDHTQHNCLHHHHQQQQQHFHHYHHQITIAIIASLCQRIDIISVRCKFHHHHNIKQWHWSIVTITPIIDIAIF